MTKLFSHRIATWALALAIGIPFSTMAAEKNPPAKLKVDSAAIERDMRSGHSYSAVIKKAAPSVVSIYSTKTVKLSRYHRFFNNPLFDEYFGGGESRGDGAQNLKQESLGSGVIVTEDGYILTNNHVVEGADEDGVEVALGDGKQKFTAKVIGTDPQTDIAVLKVDAKSLPAMTLADSDKLEVGDVVLAIGNPFNVGQSVTMGIVSAVGRGGFNITDYEDFIQTDAAINPGNSGGALVDTQGRLVGINQSILSRSGASAGVGFAVPANLAKVVLERLVEDGSMKRGFLGVGIQEISPGVARAFKLPENAAGALIAEVWPNTPAAEAGLKEGDVITEVNGKKASDSQHARLMISQNRPDSKITLTILRDGKSETVSVKLAELPSDGGATFGSTRSFKNNERDGLDGVEVDDLSSSIRRQAGIPENVRGAYVTSVDPDSNAYEAGLRPGSVIQGINRQAVNNADEAVELSEKATGDQVLLRVWSRKGDRGGSQYMVVDNTKQK